MQEKAENNYCIEILMAGTEVTLMQIGYDNSKPLANILSISIKPRYIIPRQY